MVHFKSSTPSIVSLILPILLVLTHLVRGQANFVANGDFELAGNTPSSAVDWDVNGQWRRVLYNKVSGQYAMSESDVNSYSTQSSLYQMTTVPAGCARVSFYAASGGSCPNRLFTVKFGEDERDISNNINPTPKRFSFDFEAAGLDVITFMSFNSKFTNYLDLVKVFSVANAHFDPKSQRCVCNPGYKAKAVGGICHLGASGKPRLQKKKLEFDGVPW